MLCHSIANLVAPSLHDVGALIRRDQSQRRRWRTAVDLISSAAATGSLVTSSPSTSGDTSARHTRWRTITSTRFGRCRAPLHSCARSLSGNHSPHKHTRVTRPHTKMSHKNNHSRLLPSWGTRRLPRR